MEINSPETQVSTNSLLVLQEKIPDNVVRDGILVLEIENTGAAALDEFIVKLQAAHNLAYYNYIGNTDFDSDPLIGNILFVSTNKPHTLAAGAKSQIHLSIHSAVAFAIQVKAAATTKVKINGSLR